MTYFVYYTAGKANEKEDQKGDENGSRSRCNSSEGNGHEYIEDQKIGSRKGKFAYARYFALTPKENEKQEINYNIVILSPTKEKFSLDEVVRKKEFFEKLYPDSMIELLQGEELNTDAETYRLIVPTLAGNTYRDDFLQGKLSTEIDFINYFLALVDALDYCHKVTNRAILDLTSDNVHFFNGKALLLDGGLSAVLEAKCPHKIFSVANEQTLNLRINAHTQYAPELFYIDGNEPPKITTAMDIFSLGILMENICQFDDNQYLENFCKELSDKKIEPGERQTLAVIKEKLIEMRKKLIKEQSEQLEKKFIDLKLEQETLSAQEALEVIKNIFEDYVDLEKSNPYFFWRHFEAAKGFISSCSTEKKDEKTLEEIVEKISEYSNQKWLNPESIIQAKCIQSLEVAKKALSKNISPNLYMFFTSTQNEQLSTSNQYVSGQPSLNNSF